MSKPKPMTEKELRDRLDPLHGTKKAMENTKNKILDAAFDASLSIGTGTLIKNPVVNKLTAPITKKVTQPIKKALHEATKLKWGPNIMDSVDNALPQYKAKAVQALSDKVRIQDAIKNPSPMPSVIKLNLPKGNSTTNKTSKPF